MSLASEKKHRLQAEQARRVRETYLDALAKAALHEDPEMNEPEVIGGKAWRKGLEDRLASHGFTKEEYIKEFPRSHYAYTGTVPDHD